MNMMGQKVKFDPTLNLGHLLTTASLIGTVVFAYSDLKSTDEQHATRIVAVERQIDMSAGAQRQILETLATIREDIATLKERTAKE